MTVGYNKDLVGGSGKPGHLIQLWDLASLMLRKVMRGGISSYIIRQNGIGCAFGSETVVWTFDPNVPGIWRTT